MLIAHGVDKRLGIADIETLRELFDVGIYNPDTDEWIEFEVSKYKNELFEFVKHYTSKSYDYLVTFNGINFDQQVLEWVVQEHQKWVELSNLDVCGRIYTYVQNLIENSDYGLFLPYKEANFTIPAIDLYRIHHFDNDARRTSLKWCAFMLNMDVEEMPIHHGKLNLTEEEVRIVREYRRNDVIVTKKLLDITLGNTDVPELADYAGKNKIQDRLDIQKESGLRCLNWSDVKPGEEWNKIEYMKSENITDERSIYPTKVKYPYGQRFKNFFPKTMKFTTDKLNNFIKDFGNQFVTAEKQEFPITIGITTYTVAKGGIHSTERNRKLVIPKGKKCKDADVGAQYPNSIIKLLVYPPHLKKSIIYNFIGTVEMKDHYKQLGKEASVAGNKAEANRLKGLEGGTKLRMNGGYYGKLGQKGSFLEYPEGLLKVCISNQIEILMLIEMMEEAGFQVISGNTDGIVVLFPEEQEDKYLKICAAWEKQVGNDKMGKLEYTEFLGFWQDNINSYIAKSIDEKGKIKVKKKGRFVTVYGSPGCEINKNKSNRIVPLALEAYFIDGKDPVDFIKNHKNIFDFCIAKKAAGKMHYEEQWIEEGLPKVKVHKKLVRFYISNNGTVLYKRGWNHDKKPMNNHVNAPNELGQPLVTYFNKRFEKEDYDINYNFYILEALERVDAIEKTRKAKAFIESLNPTQQLSLF